MDAAEKYKNRHRAVIEYANGAMFNVAELDAWAASNKVPLSFQKLLEDESLKDSYDATRHYVSYEILSINIAWGMVPKDTDPDDARAQLMAAHDTAEPDNPVSRLRDLVMVRYDRQLLSAVFDGDLLLYDTLAMSRIDVTAGRLRYEAHPESYMPPATAELIHEQAAYWARRQPAPLFAGPGFSDEALKQTTLTRYLQYDTWTPEAAAMLVAGLQAPIVGGHLCTEIPTTRVKGLDACWKSADFPAFRAAESVLGIWRSQANPPARVRPLDFIRWCQGRGIDTAWLRSVEEDAVSKSRAAMRAALGSGVVVIPSAPLISAEQLANDIAFSLVAIPNDERLTTVFKVTVVKQTQKETQSRREPLTGDDWRLVRSICGNPPERCSHAQFDEWCGKLDAAENRPAWSLDGDFRASDEMAKAQARWCEVSVAHKQQIVQWVRDNGLSFVKAGGIETTDLYDNAGLPVGCLRIADAKAYLDQCCIAWKIAGAQTEIVQPATAVPHEDKPVVAGNPHNPNWNLWCRKHKVTLREAVCLSCDTDPKEVQRDLGSVLAAALLPQFSASKEVRGEISDRLEIAQSHTGTGGTLSTVTGEKDGEVYLATFAEWALNTMKWDMPDELRALTHAAPSAALGPGSFITRASTDDADDAPGTKSVIGWRIAVEKQLDKLMAAHGGIYPGHKVALKWFKTNDAEAAFVPDNKDDEFTWVKADGKRVTSTLKTFQNGMADILKSKQIPD
ncbi:hypothetical protein [Paraburkholderia gardini]|uniref:hypothetical protein n=1 Tax=Paraburkholderia gardini TaxID=2823469 RepID=UPI001DF1222B|nr:hypothetical protein [Paraburkholderia gardini]CAG4891473.1 hypothetical protein R69919_01189 [Paraburkholderia gardini]